MALPPLRAGESDAMPSGAVIDFRWGIFLRIIDAGSLSKAAAAIAMPQSMVSRAISHLERQCGERLFVRTGRGVGWSTTPRCTPAPRCATARAPCPVSRRRPADALPAAPASPRSWRSPGSRPRIAFANTVSGMPPRQDASRYRSETPSQARWRPGAVGAAPRRTTGSSPGRSCPPGPPCRSTSHGCRPIR